MTPNIGLTASVHNGTCKNSFNRQDTIFSFDHTLYASDPAQTISKGSSDYDCYFFQGHSQYNTENISWVLEPNQPMLPYSVLSLVVNNWLNPDTDGYQIVLEVKSQNFDEVTREWVTNHFQRQLLFIAQNRTTALTTVSYDNDILLNDYE